MWTLEEYSKRSSGKAEWGIKKEEQKLEGAVAWNRCSRDGYVWAATAESVGSWSPRSKKRRDQTRDLRGPKGDDPAGGPATGMDCRCCGLCGSRGFQSQASDAWRGTPLLITCWKRWISLKIHRNARKEGQTYPKCHCKLVSLDMCKGWHY